VQIILILVLKSEIRRKICWFPADFSFKRLKPKNLNLQGLIYNKK
jgi:hypothetical protein